MSHRLSLRILLLVLVLGFPFGTVQGQSEPTVTFDGQIRPRSLAREPIQDQWDHWVSMRTRVGLKARFEEGFAFYVQAQDVRLWGGATGSRDISGEAVDFHQAFLDVEGLPGVGGGLRIGRQEIDWAEGRFIAAPNWGQGGQSFDGIRWTRGLGEGHLDLVYLRLREGSAPLHEGSADLTGFWLAHPLGSAGSVDVIAVHDRYREAVDTDRTTLGSTWKGGHGSLSFRFQGIYQFGQRLGKDVSAFLLAAQGTAEVVQDKAFVTLWYDHLSGDDNPLDSEETSFSSLFGARHRFYGQADYFRGFPGDLDGLGLKDLALKFQVTPTPRLSVNLDLHTFRTAAVGLLSDDKLGEELDLWVEYRFRNAMDVEAGYTYMMAGAAMEDLGLLTGTGQTLYLMTSLEF